MKKPLAVLVILLIAVTVFSLGRKYFKPTNLPPVRSTVTNSPNPTALRDEPKASVVAQNLEVPWALAFLPDGRLLITERRGSVKILYKGTVRLLSEISEVSQTGESGLHGIAVHPNFKENHYVYAYYTYSSSDRNNKNRVVRFKLEKDKLTEDKIILDEIPAASNHDGGRIKFGPDGLLYITTGDALNPSFSQNKNSLAGKILRLTDEGQVPSSNPFGSPVYSYGHRNPQGLAWDDKGDLWETEHGSTATDELNKIQKGGNFGWPDVRGDKSAPGIISPVLQSGLETWAPSGLAYINSSLFFAGLRGQGLFQVKISDQVVLSKHLDGELGRIREVIIGPDGFLYITTSNRDGRGLPRSGDDKIIKVNPSKL